MMLNWLLYLHACTCKIYLMYATHMPDIYLRYMKPSSFIDINVDNRDQRFFTQENSDHFLIPYTRECS